VGCSDSAAEEVFPPRVPVDVASLQERARPGASNEDAHDAFREILNLRERPDPDAVPALMGIVRDHEGSGRIHGFAAVQALFTEGSPRALAAVEAHAAGSQRASRRAYDYAFGWHMAADERDAYVARYVLRNEGDGPVVELRLATVAESVVPRPKAELDSVTLQRLEFVVTFRNDGAEALTMRALRSAGELLVFRARGGHFVQSRAGSSRCAPPLKPVELAPGETYRVRETVRVLRPADTRYPDTYWEGAEIGVRADGYGHFLYLLGEGGEFDVTAFWTSRTGRRVSAPVRVRVRDP